MLQQLRKAAEKAVSRELSDEDVRLTEKEIKKLLHELQVQQIELEMQNEELLIFNQEIEKQKEKFSELYNLAPVGYFLIDDTGIIREANLVGIKLFDATKTTVINRRFQIFIVS